MTMKHSPFCAWHVIYARKIPGDCWHPNGVIMFFLDQRKLEKLCNIMCYWFMKHSCSLIIWKRREHWISYRKVADGEKFLNILTPMPHKVTSFDSIVDDWAVYCFKPTIMLLLVQQQKYNHHHLSSQTNIKVLQMPYPTNFSSHRCCISGPMKCQITSQIVWGVGSDLKQVIHKSEDWRSDLWLLHSICRVLWKDTKPQISPTGVTKGICVWVIQISSWLAGWCLAWRPVPSVFELVNMASSRGQETRRRLHSVLCK